MITSPATESENAPPHRQQLAMKISSGGKRNRSNKSSQLIEVNNARIASAGRPGTKTFIDPNKLFIGNLPYDATEQDVQELFALHWGVPFHQVDERIESIKIIRDWKTGKSKGYGFLQFYEPMVATSTMLSVNQAKNKSDDSNKRGGGWKIKGRTIRLDQGQRNRDDEEEEIQRKKKEKKDKRNNNKILDEEGLVIRDALLEGAEGQRMGGEQGVIVVDEEKEEEEMSEDDMITFIEKGGLRGVMPLTMETAGFLGIEGLYEDEDVDDYYSQYYGNNGYNDEDWSGLDDDEDDDEDLENFVYDGDFEAEYSPTEYESLSEEEEVETKQMNREQRRAAEKRRKKRKLPFKGFGSPNWGVAPSTTI